MSDLGAESAAVGQVSLNRVGRVSLVRVGLLGIVVALSALLIGPPSSGSAQAAGTVGFVLAEALVLYVGYGALARVAGPAVRELLGSA